MKKVVYICGECANKMGWKMPSGHCCTTHEDRCDVCKLKKPLACENDYIKRGERKLRVWD